MKRTVCFLALLLAMTGCGYHGFGGKNNVTGSGVVKTEKRNIGAFTAVEVSGAYEVEIIAQKEPSLEIEGDDNLLPFVKTEVKNGTLYISSDRSFSTRKAIRIRATTKEIQGLSTSGASEIKLDGVKSESFVLESSGASKINVAGETKTLEVEMSGASKIDARNFRASRVKVSSSGAGRASVYATEEVNAEVSGAANVTYYGEPKVVNKEVSGAGSVSPGTAGA